MRACFMLAGKNMSTKWTPSLLSAPKLQESGVPRSLGLDSSLTTMTELSVAEQGYFLNEPHIVLATAYKLCLDNAGSIADF